MSILSPRSIAVVGASADPKKVGHAILRNLLTQGYRGEVYPVNPKGEEILGHSSFASLAEIPETVDLAIVVTPAKTVPGIIEECGKKGIGNVIVISAGFGETHTDEGMQWERDVRMLSKRHGIHLIGPNCLGLLRPNIAMNASFAKNLPPQGGIALLSQSGATAVGLMDEAARNGLGFSLVLSIGNKTVLDESDFLEMAADDGETRVIGLYLESIRDGRRFLHTVQRVLPKKPIVLLKAGTTDMGKRAAASHTGALAGADAGIAALAAQTGMRRADTLQEFTDLLSVLGTEPPLETPNIAIITNAGGPGILATDSAALFGLLLPPLTERRTEELRKALPASASIGNPIDVLGDSDAARFQAALTAAARDPGIDGLCVLLTPQVMTPCEEIAKTVIATRRSHPLLPIVTSFIGEESVAPARSLLRKAGIQTFETPERAVRALSALSTSKERHPPHREASRSGKSSSLAHATPGLLPNRETEELCARFGIPLPHQELAKSADEAVMVANRIGYPVIAKAMGENLIHKTDIGGVAGNLRNEDDVRRAWVKISERGIIDGILIQEFIVDASEFIVGMTRDPAFGILLMVGLGGIYTELFRDTSFRIAPVDEEEAYRMLESLSSWRLLLGMRGAAQADIPALARLIESVSRMAMEEPRIAELDMNPVLVSERSIVAADIKVIVR